MKKKQFLSLVSSIVITLVLIYFLFSKIELTNFLKTLTQLDLIKILPAMIVYLLLLFLRTLRFKLLLGNFSIKKLFPQVLVYNFTVNVIPFRLGELSFVYLTKKRNTSYKKSLSILFIARIFDVIVVFLALLVGILFIKEYPKTLEKLFVILAIISFVMLLGMATLIFSPSIIKGILKLILAPFQKIRLINKSSIHLFEFIDQFSHNKKNLFNVFLVSVLNYLAGFILTIIILNSLRYSIPLISLIVIIPFSVLSGIIPVQGIAGFGTYESLWVIALAAFGFSFESAVIIPFSIHIIQLVFAALFSIPGWIFLKKS